MQFQEHATTLSDLSVLYNYWYAFTIINLEQNDIKIICRLRNVYLYCLVKCSLMLWLNLSAFTVGLTYRKKVQQCITRKTTEIVRDGNAWKGSTTRVCTINVVLTLKTA